jgi:hypothetical protein
MTPRIGSVIVLIGVVIGSAGGASAAKTALVKQRQQRLENQAKEVFSRGMVDIITSLALVNGPNPTMSELRQGVAFKLRGLDRTRFARQKAGRLFRSKARQAARAGDFDSAQKFRDVADLEQTSASDATRQRQQLQSILRYALQNL